jgi:hypothetical protein
MPVIEKEVARPGTTWYIDPATSLPRKATFTPETLKYWHDQGQSMLSSGLVIPVPMEHQALGAMTPAQKAAANLANNAGWVQGYKFKKIKDEDGNEVEALFSDVDITDISIANKLPHTIRYTSPWISSFVDGNGKSWNGVISHLALTTRPRIVKQTPFQNLSAAMSLADNLLDTTFDPKTYPVAAGGFALSRAGNLKKRTDGKLTPCFPLAFSLWTGIGLADDVPFKKKEEKPAEKKEGKGESKLPPGGTEEGEKPEGEGITEGEGQDILQEEAKLIDEDGDISIYEVLCDLLEAVGLTIGECNSDNFMQKLYEATMSQIKGGQGGLEKNDMGTPNNTPPGAGSGAGKAPLMQEQPPLYMSLEQAQAITDPNQRAMALSIIHLQTKSERLEKNAIDRAKYMRQARLDRLYKRLPPTARDKLAAMAQGAGFSMNDDGSVADSMDGYLALLESSMPDLPTLLTGDSKAFSEQPHPKQYDGVMSEERRQSIVKEVCRSGGITTVPAPSPN